MKIYQDSRMWAKRMVFDFIFFFYVCSISSDFSYSFLFWITTSVTSHLKWYLLDFLFRSLYLTSNFLFVFYKSQIRLHETIRVHEKERKKDTYFNKLLFVNWRLCTRRFMRFKEKVMYWVNFHFILRQFLKIMYKSSNLRFAQ